MDNILPFRRKVKAPCGVAYHYPVGARETLTLKFHALSGWTGWITLGNGQAIHFNRWAGNMTEVRDALIDLYTQQEMTSC